MGSLVDFALFLDGEPLEANNTAIQYCHSNVPISLAA